MPMDSPILFAAFLPFAKRFANTFAKFPPGMRCKPVVVLNKCQFDSQKNIVFDIFDPIAAVYESYDGDGYDLGSQQMVAKKYPGHFQINCTSRNYFWKADWLPPIYIARRMMGPGLYGVSASREGGNLHICTRGHCYDTDDFSKFPWEVKSRNDGVKFEVGPTGSLTNWYRDNGKPVRVVNWLPNGESVTMEIDRFDQVPNCFRRGDQSGMLMWDRHSDLFRDANPQQKKELARKCFEAHSPEIASEEFSESIPRLC